MGKIAIRNAVFSCQITREKKAYIEQRANSCGATKSIYGEAIIEYWLKAGAPPLFARETYIPLPPFKELPRYTRTRPQTV